MEALGLLVLGVLLAVLLAKPFIVARTARRGRSGALNVLKFATTKTLCIISR